MGTVLKIGEQAVSTYKNMAQYPVPYSSGQVTASYYTPNPNPGTTISYLLDQLDGPTTRSYNQYLEDYARFTVPLLGAGTEADPYYFYQYPVLARTLVNMTAADFVTKPILNVHFLLRIPAGVQIRTTVFWYNAANAQVWTSLTAPSVTTSADWLRVAALFPAPPNSVLSTVTYARVGVEVMSGMTAAQNYWDMTGFRATPVYQSDFNDFRGNYWDGSTTFTQPHYVPSWDGTPRSSLSTLTITEIATISVQTENEQTLSVAEDVTGLDASAISGGSGQGNMTIAYSPNAPDYLGLSAEMLDTSLGNFYGKIRNLSESAANGTAAIVVDESLALLNAWVVAPPISGTVATVLSNYVSLAEASIRPFSFEDGVDLIPVNAPGFVGNLYDKIREFLAAYSAELVTIDGLHVVRSTMRDSIILDNFSEGPEVTSNLQQTSELVRVHWYDNEYVTNGQVYPLAANPGEADEEIPEPTVYSVGANEVLNIEIQLRASLLSINTPLYVSFVPDEDVTGTGVYTAVGSDSLPITPSQWADQGGKIEVSISEDDPSVAKVKLTGPDIISLAPFRIAMSSGSGNYYNALHITGTGMFVRDQAVDLATGALPSVTGQKYATECTNPYISTEEQAYQVGQVIAGRVQQEQSVSFTIPTPTNQVVFGLLPGKKFVHANQQFRVETTDVNNHTMSCSGSYALTVADYDHFFTRGAAFTVADFDGLYTGVTLTALNFSLKPLLHRFQEV